MTGLNKTEYKALIKYRTNFHTAVYSDYSRNMMRADMEKLVQIIEKKTGKAYPMNYSCGACQLKVLKIVGKLFFEAETAYKEDEPELSINKIEEGATNKEQKGKKKDGKQK